MFRTATMLLLLALPLLSQVNPEPKGAVTGMVLSSNGTPAAGVRIVAIPASDPTTAGATVFESLAQTDSFGRYRLDAASGRYFIAAGAVSLPTFFPNTTNIASAEVIVIKAGATIEGVNFSQFIPAAPTLNGVNRSAQQALPPGSTGVLSGVLRYPDGAPASGITVVAVVQLSGASTSPAAVPPALPSLGLPQIQFQPNIAATLATSTRIVGNITSPVRFVTDINGRYRLSSIPPNTYVIMAGYADAPVFYPGVSDIQKASAIATTPTTMLDTLNFTVPALHGTIVHVHVSAAGGRPGGGATLTLRGIDLPATGLASILPQRTYKMTTTAGDGLLDFTNVLRGKYSIQAAMFGTATITKTIEVTNQPIEVNFEFPVKVLAGKVLWDDGRPFSDSEIHEVAVSTTSNPNFIASTLFPIAGNGMFSAVLESNDYRVFIRNLPDGYVIKSVTAGTTDLTRENLHFDADAPVDVEVRIAKQSNAAANIQGRVMDSITRNGPQADRIQLCCLASGPFERISTPLHADGSFEFTGVPAGRYTAELTGSNIPGIANPILDVSVQGLSGLTLVSAANFATITAVVVTDGSDPLPEGRPVLVTLTPSSGEPFHVSLLGTSNENLWSTIPIGLQYNVEVSNFPPGFKVKSLVTPDSQTATFRLIGNTTIRIVLTKE